MNWRHSILFLALLALPVTARAQYRPGRPASPGNMQQQQQIMQQRMMQEQQRMMQEQQRMMMKQAIQQQQRMQQQRMQQQRQMNGQQGAGLQSTPQQSGPKQEGRQQMHTKQQKGTTPGATNPPNAAAEQDQGQQQKRNQRSGKSGDRPAAAPKKRRETDAHKLPLATDEGDISLLHTVHLSLGGADHDYQGHRIRAMEHVSAALRHLGAPFDLNTSFGPGAGNRSQAQSDQVLRDAISQLRNVESSLGRATSTDAHHQHPAQLRRGGDPRATHRLEHPLS